MRPLVLQLIHRKLPEKKGPHPSQPAVVLDEYSVSNGNVQKLEDCFVVVRRRELQEKAKIWDNRILRKDLTGQSKDMGPTCKHVAAWIGTRGLTFIESFFPGARCCIMHDNAASQT